MFGFNIGVDILHLPRLHRVILRRSAIRLAQHILTIKEREMFKLKFHDSLALDEQYHKRRKMIGEEGKEPSDEMVKYLGVRWASKEAAYKASIPQQVVESGVTKYTRPTWSNFEVLYKPWGQPYISVRKDQEQVKEGKLSISHDGEYIVATALIPEG